MPKDSRPLLSREEWECLAVERTWREYLNASTIIVWMRPAQKKLLLEGGRNGRGRRTQILRQPDQRSRKSTVDESTSSNYTLQELVTESKEEVGRYRAENRNLKDTIDLSREGSSTDAKEGWVLRKGSGFCEPSKRGALRIYERRG